MTVIVQSPSQMSSHNRNPGGKNQYGDVLKADDEMLSNALNDYHREGLTSNAKISARLLADHGITMSDTTVKRRRAALGLYGSQKTLKTMPMEEAEQLVVEQMDKDPAKRHGPRTTKHKIINSTGIHLPRDFVNSVMHQHDPDAFGERNPSGKKIQRSQKKPIGIHERWAGDGHDKLYKIGFPIWAVVDDATTKWLGAWVVPSNRMGIIVGYLFLLTVEKYGGIPLQFTTDCGSETTFLYGLGNALREIFHPDYDNQELPAHVYLRSIHNISIERSWLRLRCELGDNAVLQFEKGEADGIYRPQDPQHYELCQWIWPKLLRKELDAFMISRNSFRSRKDNQKAGPSGMSRNEAFSMPQNWGGRNCLLEVDVDVIRQIKEEMGGDQLLEFVSSDFSQHAQTAYDSLNIQDLSMENIWFVFRDMLPLLYP